MFRYLTAGESHGPQLTAIIEGLPAGVGLIVLAVPITRLLFEHGQFKGIDTLRTAWVLLLAAIAYTVP